MLQEKGERCKDSRGQLCELLRPGTLCCLCTGLGIPWPVVGLQARLLLERDKGCQRAKAKQTFPAHPAFHLRPAVQKQSEATSQRSFCLHNPPAERLQGWQRRLNTAEQNCCLTGCELSLALVNQSLGTLICCSHCLLLS